MPDTYRKYSYVFSCTGLGLVLTSVYGPYSYLCLENNSAVRATPSTYSGSVVVAGQLCPFDEALAGKTDESRPSRCKLNQKCFRAASLDLDSNTNVEALADLASST